MNSLAELKKKYNRLRVVLSVGGGGEGSKPFAGVARDPAKRDQFARSSLELVQHFQYLIVFSIHFQTKQI